MTEEPWPNRPWLAEMPTRAPSRWRPVASPRSCHTSSQTWATALGGDAATVNPSGGLACFGEAVPAQAIAQVCELVWQLRGDALGRQHDGARVGISANQGLFGHGSSMIVVR